VSGTRYGPLDGLRFAPQSIPLSAIRGLTTTPGSGIPAQRQHALNPELIPAIQASMLADGAVDLGTAAVVGDLAANRVTAGTLVGFTVKTASTGARVELSDDVDHAWVKIYPEWGGELAPAKIEVGHVGTLHGVLFSAATTAAGVTPGHLGLFNEGEVHLSSQTDAGHRSYLALTSSDCYLSLHDAAGEGEVMHASATGVAFLKEVTVSALVVTGHTHMQGSGGIDGECLEADDGITAHKEVTFDGAAYAFHCDCSTTFDGTVQANGAVTLASTLHVDGGTTFDGEANFNAALHAHAGIRLVDASANTLDLRLDSGNFEKSYNGGAWAAV
jgi:hypothetical protein